MAQINNAHTLYPPCTDKWVVVHPRIAGPSKKKSKPTSSAYVSSVRKEPLKISSRGEIKYSRRGSGSRLTCEPVEWNTVLIYLYSSAAYSWHDRLLTAHAQPSLWEYYNFWHEKEKEIQWCLLVSISSRLIGWRNVWSLLSTEKIRALSMLPATCDCGVLRELEARARLFNGMATCDWPKRVRDSGLGLSISYF